MNAFKSLFYLVNLLACLAPTFVSLAKKVCLCDTLEVCTSTTLNGTATVNATSTFNAAATFNNPVTLNAAETVNGTANFNGAATFDSSATFNGTVIDNGAVTMNNNLTVGSPSNHPIANFDNAIFSNLAPSAITVSNDPLFIANGFDKFNKIQDALNFLQNKRMPPSTSTTTTITILSGTYPENVVYGALDGSDINLTIQGIDFTRPIVGVGYVNGSFWNVIGSPNATIGGGVGSKALITLDGTKTILTITNVGSGINPNFSNTNGVVVGDKILVSGNDSSGFNIYTVMAVAPQTLTVSSPITQNINGNQVASVTILPTVIIAPTSGVPFTNLAFEGVNLAAVTLMPPANQIGFKGFAYTNTQIGNSAIIGGTFGISLNNYAAISTPLTTPGITNGISVVGATINALSMGNNCYANALNSLLATPTTAPRITIFANAAGAYCAISRSTIINTVMCNQSGVLAAAVNLATIITGNPAIPNSGTTSLTIGNGSRLELFTTGEIQIQDLSLSGPAIGVDVRNAGISAGPLTSLSISSSNPAFIGVRLGGSESVGATEGGDQSVGKIAFASINIPAASGTSIPYIAQVLGGSSLTVENVGTVSVGANSNGFLVDSASSLVWRAGNITGNSSSTSGTLFDIERCSSMVLFPANTAYQFSNYPTLFNVNANSKLYGFDVTTSFTNGFDLSGAPTHYKADKLSDIVLENPSLTGGTASITLSNGSRLNAITPTFNNGICPTNSDNTGQIILSPGSGCPNQCPTACS